jgi:hypothetical protein
MTSGSFDFYMILFSANVSRVSLLYPSNPPINIQVMFSRTGNESPEIQNPDVAKYSCCR